MPNYKEEIIQGQITQYRRCEKIIISNPLNGVPSICFVERDITILPDSTEIVGNLRELFIQFNPVEDFEILNLMDDTVTGLSDHEDIYVMLYSAYRYYAKQRDLQEPIL